MSWQTPENLSADDMPSLPRFAAPVSGVTLVASTPTVIPYGTPTVNQIGTFDGEELTFSVNGLFFVEAGIYSPSGTTVQVLPFLDETITHRCTPGPSNLGIPFSGIIRAQVGNVFKIRGLSYVGDASMGGAMPEVTDLRIYQIGAY